MQVKKDPPHHIEHAGKSFYFCSEKCLGTFKREPGTFTAQQDKAEPAFEHAAPGTIYTCPMQLGRAPCRARASRHASISVVDATTTNQQPPPATQPANSTP